MDKRDLSQVMQSNEQRKNVMRGQQQQQKQNLAGFSALGKVSLFSLNLH